MKYLICILFLSIVFTTRTVAAEDPRGLPNNKVGIGLLSPDAEIEEAAGMVNAGGQWGWVLLTIKKSERDVNRWQNVFSRLTEQKLIPIVRISTDFNSSGVWQKPSEEDAKSWADFLSKLYWPTKNKYVQVYNEVNRGGEWGGLPDSTSYAQELNKTVDELKLKDPDFFVLAAPLDLALSDSADSIDASRFFDGMESAEPGIFRKLDGWASHSYPNPGFSSSPYQSGRLGISGYKWELEQIKDYLGGKDLPVFITETGWDRNAVGEEQMASFYEIAFREIWNDQNVVSVTPFVFNYPDGLYNSFSFKTDGQTLGRKYFAQFEKIRSLPKTSGEPTRINLASSVKLTSPDHILKGQSALTILSFKNEGNIIWNSSNFDISVFDPDLKIIGVEWNKEKIFPGQMAFAILNLSAANEGPHEFDVNVSSNGVLIVNDRRSLVVENHFTRLIRILKLQFNA